VYRAGIKADELALEVFRRMGVYLGIGLANLIKYSQSEMIVIGGGVVNAWERLRNTWQREIADVLFRACGGS